MDLLDRENIFSDASSITITGLKVSYYHICRTKLWLFSHHIQMEQENENVQIGRQIHENRYRREKKDVCVNNAICIDYIKSSEKEQSPIVLHEIKKTDILEAAHRWQMLYYLYYLKIRGVEAVGELNYPLIGKTEKIVLTADNEAEIGSFLEDIARIISERMPAPEKTKICPKCAYYEFCFGD